MSKPPFVFQQISKHGSSHPVVARLVMQSQDLLGFTRFDKETKDKAFSLFVELHRRLLQCHDIADRIFAERERTIASYLKELGEGSSSLPHAIDLDMEAENFLLVAKHYLRDLVKALNLLLDAKLPVDSSVFWDKKGAGQSEVVKWATKTYGEQHHVTKMFAEEDVWVSELVKKRNAVEHPGGYSGNLLVQNYRYEKDVGVHAPLWRRDGPDGVVEGDIFNDIKVYLDNMLTLAEDIIATAVMLNNAHGVITVAEIPVAERNAMMPKRLKMVFTEEFARKNSRKASE